MVRRRGQTWVENVERRSPGWRPGRRLSIYVAYWVWVWSVSFLCIWLDAVEYQAGSVAEGEGALVYKAKSKLLRLD